MLQVMSDDVDPIVWCFVANFQAASRCGYCRCRSSSSSSTSIIIIATVTFFL